MGERWWLSAGSVFAVSPVGDGGAPRENVSYLLFRGVVRKFAFFFLIALPFMSLAVGVPPLSLRPLAGVFLIVWGVLFVFYLRTGSYQPDHGVVVDVETFDGLPDGFVSQAKGVLANVDVSDPVSASRVARFVELCRDEGAAGFVSHFGVIRECVEV